MTKTCTRQPSHPATQNIRARIRTPCGAAVYAAARLGDSCGNHDAVASAASLPSGPGVSVNDSEGAQPAPWGKNLSRGQAIEKELCGTSVIRSESALAVDANPDQLCHSQQSTRTIELPPPTPRDKLLRLRPIIRAVSRTHTPVADVIRQTKRMSRARPTACVSLRLKGLVAVQIHQDAQGCGALQEPGADRDEAGVAEREMG
ncbi:hypothetical protein C8R47DRAFT_1202363 [Mycena vitilis]|nr:hypothetical protein C8R47DRAFT_1202363 [Mycena vitilis]